MERSQIHNYFEHLVFDYIDQHIIPDAQKESDDYFLDMACIALNKLPTRYVRYEVDMAFFLHPEERGKMQESVKTAVTEAKQYIDEHFDSRR